MKRRYDIYGFKASNLDEAARLVEDVLGVGLTMRDSDYWGVYYRAGEGAARDLMLYENEQGEWYTPEHKTYGVILLVNDVAGMDEIHHKLISGRTDPVLLRTRVYSDKNSDEPEEE